jgi:hypothetical protein
LKINYVHIFDLIDRKSADQPCTLVQMLSYAVRIWENALADGRPLVPILPWVIYNDALSSNEFAAGSGCARCD